MLHALQCGPQEEIAQIAAHKDQVEAPVLGQGSAPDSLGEEGPQGAQAQHQHEPEPQQIPPQNRGEPVGHLFQKGSQQVHGHQRVEEPVGDHHRIVQEIAQQGGGSRRVTPGGEQDDEP